MWCTWQYIDYFELYISSVIYLLYLFSFSHAAFYRARNYSVTPLGLRSGLIQWVDGCVPLFSLYKRWQVREANASQSKSGGPSSTVQRPSEVSDIYHFGCYSVILWRLYTYLKVLVWYYITSDAASFLCLTQKSKLLPIILMGHHLSATPVD